MILSGDLYCSIDKYCRRCDPQGTKGSGGDTTCGDSIIGGLTSVGICMNSDGSTRGGVGTLGMTGGSGIVAVVGGPPIPSEGPGLGMNTGVGDLFLITLLRPLRRVRSPLRNVWFFRMW